MDGEKGIKMGFGRWGYVLAAVIIAVRAFQPGAEPMSEWSCLSWAMMTLPITWEWILFAVLQALVGLVELVAGVFRE